MINIRTGCFETNSSSCHSICIPKHDNRNYDGQSIHFDLDSYGWECRKYYDDAACYLYSAIVGSFEFKEAKNFLKRLKKILDKHHIHYTFDPIRLVKNEWGEFYEACDKDIWDYGIDHGGELRSMIEALLNDEDLLLRYLFGDTVIYTGNDNNCEEDDMCYCADETIWDSTKHELILNPNHCPSKYDYFFKGN